MSFPMQTFNPRNLFNRILSSLMQMPDFRGRATVIDFFLGMIVLSFLGHLTDGLLADRSNSIGTFHSWGSAVCGLLALSLVVRRLHDHNRSGWFSLMVLPNILINILARYRYEIGLQPSPSPEFPYYFIFVIVMIVFYGVMLLPGTEGPNRFGPDPRSIAQTIPKAEKSAKA